MEMPNYKWKENVDQEPLSDIDSIYTQWRNYMPRPVCAICWKPSVLERTDIPAPRFRCDKHWAWDNSDKLTRKE